MLTGLEAWCAMPLIPAGQTPVRWKMACVTWLAIFPTVSLLLGLVAPWLEGLPFLARTAVITGLAVPVMTWILLPCLVRLFRPWLLSNQ